MRHFSAFLQQVRDLKDRASGFEAEVHYARLDAILNALGVMQETLTYRELGKALGVFSAKLGAMLGRRLQDDHASGEPLSSALIVNRNTGISSPGFFEMARSLGYVFNDNDQFWREQRDRCFDRFNEATVSMTLNTGLTDEEQEKVERADRAIATAMIAAGVVERAAWAAEPLNGRRVIRLRTGSRIVLELTEAELAKSSEVTLVDMVRNRLAR
jgi:hypothetical protein